MDIHLHLHIHIHHDKKDTPSSTKGLSADTSCFGGDFLESIVNTARKLDGIVSQSTANNYQTAIRSFSAFCSEYKGVCRLDDSLIQCYERWLRERGVSPNTSSCYMRSLRSILTRLGQHLNIDFRDLFEKVYTGNMKTSKRAVSLNTISSLRNLTLPEGTFRCLTRDLFVFSFCALGMPFVDMAYLRKTQINDGHIVYFRHKTGQRVALCIEPEMEKIINHYICDDRQTVFPIITSEDPLVAQRQYLQVLNRYNRTLKHLALLAGVSENITSYTSRHTWASVAYSQNVDIPIISKALGHTNPQTTLIYVKEINDDRLEEANRNILKMMNDK